MHFNKRIFSVLAGLMVVGAANAAVLFSQPTQDADGYFSDSINYAGSQQTFYESAVADNFTLANASTVTQIAFWGSTENFFGPPSLGNLAGLQINVYNSTFGLISANSVATGALTPVATGFANSNGGNEFRFTFNTSIVLGAGSYWLHVGGTYTAPNDDAFVWSTNHTNGDGTSAFANLDVSNTFVPGSNDPGGPAPENWDQAFEIRGDAVPEPATMAVLGLGVAALLRRRRK